MYCIKALRIESKGVKGILQDIKATSKQDYLKKEPNNFGGGIHDYGDNKKGFI